MHIIHIYHIDEKEQTVLNWQKGKINSNNHLLEPKYREEHLRKYNLATFLFTQLASDLEAELLQQQTWV